MGRVKVTRVVKAPLEKVYSLGQDIYSFEAMCPNLKKIKVMDENEQPRTVRSEWTVEAHLLAAKRSLSWVQDETWDDSKMCCTFDFNREYKTEMQKFEGCWTFREHPRGTEMIMDVDFKVKHPLVNGPIHRIIDGIMKKNNEALLKGIKKRAEKS